MLIKNIRPVFVIAVREVRDQFRDWRIIFPVLGLTVFFPFLMNFTAQMILNFVKQYEATIVGERLIPFLLMIVGFFPISVSLVIALETFVGEKERMSIEPLLNTPLKDWQLYLGKLLSSTVPPLVSSYLGMGVYISGLLIQRITLPEPDIMILILLLTLVQAFVMVAGAVVVSSQATSVRAANLLASFIIIPMALMIQGESVIMFWGDYRTLWWVLIGLVALTTLFVRVGLVHFQREELLGKEIDVLNFKWGWRVFWRSFTGGARSVQDWYLRAVPKAVRGMSRPFLVITLLALVGVLVGFLTAQQLSHAGELPPQWGHVDNPQDRISGLLQEWPLFAGGPVVAIWWQNVRSLLLGMVLGVFSMGILGVLPIFATMAVMGGLMNILANAGVSVPLYLTALILPHGILEVPAAILASATILQAGAILATPTPGKTVSEVWITALGEWAKIMLGVVIPLLLVAAGVEAWVTPRVAYLLFH
jgi:ABC-type transport system involved in multi-copper enzyme maturation permease subunit